MKLTLRDWIGVALIVAFIAAVGVLFWKAIPTENEQLIVYMLGQLSGFVAGVVSFHYVMSKDDAQKTANTAAAFEAITATANAASTSPSASAAADEVAEAAVDAADQIKGKG